MEYQCLICNKKFLGRGYRKYCSSSCSRKAKNNYSLKFYYSHKEQHNRRVMDWQKRNKDKVKIIKKRYCSKPENRERVRRYARKRFQTLRLKALIHYSTNPPQCACCSEQHIEFLALDHIKGKGTQHRNQIKDNMWNWVTRNKYPEGFRVLCHNCNSSIGFYGYCPHQKLKN